VREITYIKINLLAIGLLLLISIVNATSPIASFNITPNPVSITIPVYFVDMSVNGPTTWNWSFGDGSYSVDQNPTHIFINNGIFTIILNVSNIDGYSNFSSNMIVNSLPPVANFTATPHIGTSPLAVTFTDTSSGCITSWLWLFGDGNTSTLQNPSYTYTSLGTFPVSLHVTSSVGDNTSQSQLIYVITSAIPMVNFVGAPTSGSAPLSVQFTDMSLALGAINGWNWSFGDGNYSNQQNPSHIYASTGQYSVTLVASSGVLSNYTSKVGYINIGILPSTVSAYFSGTPLYAASYPANIQFTDASVCNPVCTNWAWDFNNDGLTESLQKNPLYTYTYPGNYTVKLIVSNGINFGTKIRVHYITIGPAFTQPTIPQPTKTWHPGYQTNNTPFMFTSDTSLDLANSTYLKYWLQNFTATKNFSVYGFATSLMAPLMHVFGFWIYLVIWSLYMFAVWIRSQDVTLPVVIGILSIGTFGLLFPKESLPVILIMFAICGAIIITKLMKDSI
jgi:PKD repeat protein